MVNKQKIFVMICLFILLVTTAFAIIDFETSNINRPSLSELTSNETEADIGNERANRTRIIDDRLQRLYEDYKIMPEPSDEELLMFINDIHRDDIVTMELSDAELIELGRQSHPYYVTRNMLRAEGFEV